MEIELRRVVRANLYTEGRMYIDGHHVCDTVEDKDRDANRNGVFDAGEVKVYGRTAIPNGRYRVTLEYSPKFSPRYGGRRIPFIHDVPGFDGVRIHTGNTSADSLGCIIVGVRARSGVVANSKDTFFNKVLPPMAAADVRKEEMWITVR